ncbi:MAG TPA: dehydrogenase, partial [Acidimicrobiaceae bacterium]|nr:dehydrogenase [Acidimicrobiaceae bacterium]
MARSTAARNTGAKVAAANGRAKANGAGSRLQQFAAEELVEDFRLSCLSRALDDREIMLQKQSRVFFQISGAGHEILYTALARSLLPGYDWFF